LQKMKGMPL